MPPGGTLQSGTLPRRLTANAAFLCMRPSQFEVGLYVIPTYADLATPANVLGPVRDVTIDDPFLEMNQTAYGDPGMENYPTRKGTWSINIEAGYDTSGGVTALTAGAPIYGDFRWGSLMHQPVDFLLLRYDYEFAFYPGIVMGAGVFSGEIAVPASDGGSIIRRIRIRRRFGGVMGNLRWANIATGVFG